MTPDTVFTLILVIVVADFLFNIYLDYLNFRHTQPTLPDELKDVYDANEYQRQQEYKKNNTLLGFAESLAGFVALMLFLLLGGIPWLDSAIRQHTTHPVAIALVYFGVIALAASIIHLPFSVYHTFVIEERFGFNKTTLRLFITDKIKGMLLAVMIGGGLLSVIITIYLKAPTTFWIYTWIVISLFSIIMTMFYSNLIVPLFNRQTPLAEGQLRNAIELFAASTGFGIKNIYVIDGSKRSSKANAYFTGFGPKKRVVLYDTLIQEMTTDEIVAVLAHEIGHYKHRHILINLAVSVISTGLMLFILNQLISNPLLSLALGVEQPSFHVGLTAFGILFSPISFLTGIFGNIYSRFAEYQADRFVKAKGIHEHLIAALKKLTAKNLSNLTPHPLYVKVHYSHPTLLQRIRALL